jgi:peptide chain release factor 1
MFENCEDLAREFTEVERSLADPAVHADQTKARTLGRRYAQLRPVVAAYREWSNLHEDHVAAVELADMGDVAFADEAVALAQKEALAAERLRTLLVPRDPLDDKDVIVEVKAGEGGEESALFAGDLLGMYLRYAGRRGW